jgi:hypothetical protein
MNESQRYLLGEMKEAEREAYRERLLADPELFAEVEAEEVELLDSYARGEASPQRRTAIERHLLASPLQRRRLSISRALAAQKNPAWIRYAGLAVAALLCLGVYYFLRPSRPLPNNAAPAILVARLAVPPPVSRSSAEIPHLKVDPASAALVELSMSLTPALAGVPLNFSLRNSAGKELASGPANSNGQNLIFSVQRNLLPQGSYELAVVERTSGAPRAFTYFILD